MASETTSDAGARVNPLLTKASLMGSLPATSAAGSVHCESWQPEAALRQQQWFENGKNLGSKTFVLSRWYRTAYCAYLFCVIFVGALALCLSDNSLNFLDSLYLAVSSISMTGLSPTDFSAMPFLSYAIVWAIIVLGSPMLMTLFPVVLRRRAFRKQIRFMQEQSGRRSADVELPFSPKDRDEYVALSLIMVYVPMYYISVQFLGFALLWIFFSVGDPLSHRGPMWANAIFVSTSAFHNAGLSAINLGEIFPGPLAGWVLSVIATLILLGNTCFPVALRLMIWAFRRPLPFARGCLADRDHVRRARRMLLDDPRRCYTHLFPNAATQALLAVLCLLYVLQAVVFLVTEVGVQESPVMAKLSIADRLLATHFTVISSRTAGFTVLDLGNLGMASAFALCVAMWISTSPVVVTMRSTSTECRLAQEQRQQEEFDLAEGAAATFDYAGAMDAQEKYNRPRQVGGQLKRFMSEHSAVLVLLFFVILICETLHDDSTGEGRGTQRADFLPFLVEFCSAWGTVGLSMTSKAASLSGAWSPGGKLALMAVMFLGRLRGLPDSIDPSVRLGVQPLEESFHSSMASASEAGSMGDSWRWVVAESKQPSFVESFHSANSGSGLPKQKLDIIVD